MSKVKRFNNLGEFIKETKLEQMVQRVSSLDKGYGQIFDEHVADTLKAIGCNVQKTGPEYDIVKGADIKFMYQGGSISFDVKLNKASAFNRDKYINEFYISDGLELSKCSNDIFYYPLVEGLEVGFILRRGKITKHSRFYFDKHILVAVFSMNTDKQCSAHDLFNEEAAKEFAKYVTYINETLIRENMPAKDKQSFTVVKSKTLYARQKRAS